MGENSSAQWRGTPLRGSGDRSIWGLKSGAKGLPGGRGLAFVAEIMLEGIGVLHPAEFNREAALDLADDAAPRAAQPHRRAAVGRDLRCDGRTPAPDRHY